MNGEVNFLKPSANNPVAHPTLTDALKASVVAKTAEVLALLKNAVQAFTPITFANSFGAEDMVLTDIILKNQLNIAIF